jgi:hypothetical protein
MKITVDFIRAEQHWDPDTEEQRNFLVFSFAGKEHRIPCTEDDIVEAVRSAKSPAPARGGIDAHARALHRAEEPSWSEEVEDEVGDVAAEELEREFGGDIPVVNNPPLTFVEPEPLRPRPTENGEQLRREMIEQGMGARPRTAASIKADKLARLRQVAQRAPHSRVEKDEMGYPVVTGGAAAPRPAAEPTVVRREIPSISDDDPFGQG